MIPLSIRLHSVLATLSGVVLMVACSTPTVPSPVTATTPLKAQALTTYYVDNQSGSNCSNAGSGTSSSAPWCDFTPVNARGYGPGDQILLARGATWNQQMTLSGAGSSSNYASVGAYGTGARPKIIRSDNATDRAVRLNDPAYWTVSDLEVGNAGAGILVYFTTLSHEGLTFNNLYAHDIRGIHQGNRFTNGDINCMTTDRIWNSAGLEFTGDESLKPSPTQYVIRNVSVSSFEGTHNLSSISFDFCNGIAGVNAVHNAFLNNLYLHEDNGPAEGCDEGLRLSDIRDSILLNSRLIHEGACASSTGTIAVILGLSQNLSLVNSLISDVPNTISNDQGGVDFEFDNSQTKLRGLTLADNAGPAVELLAIHPPPDNFNLNIEIASCAFSNNGQANRNGQIGGINQLGNLIIPTGIIKDNLYVEPAGLLTTAQGGSFSGFTTSNNLSVSTLYSSAKAFSGTQGTGNWSYQYSNNGSSWQNLTFDSTQETWLPSGGASVPQVKRFEQHPAAGSALAARVWTAPLTGVVSVRGWILKTDTRGGDGVTARITRNGTIVWGPQALSFDDQVGLPTNVDTLSVSTGDTLRFEVGSGSSGNDNYDMTSWSPFVGYTSLESINQGTLNNSGFESPSVTTYVYTPSGTGWTFTGGGGIQRTGSAFGAASAPEGSQTAFLQSTASLSQSVSLGAGTYSIKFKAARRQGQIQPLKINVDGTQIGGLITPTGDSFGDYSSINFTLTTGSHTVKFETIDSNGDKTSFIDAVQIITAGNPVQNASFESPSIADFQYIPTGSGWIFNKGGIQHNGGAFAAENAPDGVQTAFVQGNAKLSQTVDLSAGSHTVSFYTARRSGQVQPLMITIDGTQVGGLVTPSNNSFSSYTSAAFNVTAGNHILAIEGTDDTGDKTSFIDAVSIQ